MRAFKAYDIRGVYGKDLNPEIIYKIGFFLPRVISMKKVLVGRDIRISSNEAFEALSNGFTDAGVEVADAGLTTTPMIYWGTGKYDFDASIMITASHNPKEHNGLKVSSKGVLPVGYDNGLSDVEKMVENEKVEITARKGTVTSFDFHQDYLDFLSQYKDDYSDLNIVVDCSNGMATLFTKQLLGNNVHSINCTADGTFPGHEPNPLEPENQVQIKKAVLDNKADIGVFYDGDADRVMFIDEKGHFVSPDLMIALLGHYFFDMKKERGTVVHDIRTSKAVAEYLKKHWDTEVAIWRVGRAYGATKLRELDGVFGGELAGHYYFRDFYYSDSGIMASLIFLDILKQFKKEGKTFSQLISEISEYANTGEVNFKIEHKQQAMDVVKDYFFENEYPEQFYDFDGYRLEFENWWFNIRPSNTEPYLRFLAEAKTDALLQQKTAVIYSILKKFE
ncbi:MAG: phosphomannomutase/phosphoglucomutase [Bacteroidetes bacterium]|nr:MAG: phosphomannomutase/phosphoglucomutase [Bacteroidota bacterium]